MNGIRTAFSGRIGTEPEPRYTRAGKALLNFSVAVDQHTTATEERAAPETQWVRVTCWDERAEELADVLKKGMAVYCEGRLTLHHWTAQDGTERHSLNVSAGTVQPLGAIGGQAPKRPAARVGKGATSGDRWGGWPGSPEEG